MEHSARVNVGVFKRVKMQDGSDNEFGVGGRGGRQPGRLCVQSSSLFMCFPPCWCTIKSGGCGGRSRVKRQEKWGWVRLFVVVTMRAVLSTDL